MNKPSGTGAAAAPVRLAATPGRVALFQIFTAFLVIGITSIGGGLVAYLRRSLVAKRGWVDDPTFVQLLSISEALPGLNGTNIAILAGDRLRGARGAAAAILGICLPGALIMWAAAVAYDSHGDRPVVAAMLATIAAAAVGLTFSVTVQLGQNLLKRISDFVLVALTVLLVHWLHVSILVVLLGVGALAIWWYRPRPNRGEAERQ
jgi:chromate transporter